MTECNHEKFNYKYHFSYCNLDHDWSGVIKVCTDCGVYIDKRYVDEEVLSNQHKLKSMFDLLNPFEQIPEEWKKYIK